MSKLEDLRDEIKVDLGCDVVSLGISDSSIELKIKEALRKISIYAPYVEMVQFTPSSSGAYELPEDTTTVVAVYNLDSTSAQTGSVIADDTDLFSVSRYLYNYNDMMDPYQFIMQKTGIQTLQNFVSLSDWRYEESSHLLLLNGVDSGKTYCAKYLRKYRDIEEIEDEDLYQYVKEYALALCKIIEGHIRRKLQSAPGAIQLDGDQLVSEGTDTKNDIEQSLPRKFQYLQFGIRA